MMMSRTLSISFLAIWLNDIAMQSVDDFAHILGPASSLIANPVLTTNTDGDVIMENPLGTKS